MATLASFLLFVKLKDWLRLFSTTSFFVLLVERTIIGISPFLILFFVSLIMFAFPISIVNLGGMEDDDAILIEEYFESWFIDAFYTTFTTANAVQEQAENYYQSKYRILVIVIYTIAILYTQIVMLNMLIALMSDIFENLMEHF